MKILLGSNKESFDRLSVTLKEDIVKCREVVGYQEDPEWICPYLGTPEHQLAFKEKHQGKYVGGFICYPCMAMEATDWQKRGLPLPEKIDERFITSGWVRIIEKDEEPVAQPPLSE